MLAVSPDMHVSGTLPARWYTLLKLWECMYASSSKQSSVITETSGCICGKQLTSQVFLLLFDLSLSGILSRRAFAKFKGRFCMPVAVNGNSFVWLQLYSLPYTKVLGFVAWCTTSK